jgi:AICAR transformylase/IMP cyclohydrolase PurH
MIDIGGPTLLRAAAKNFLHVGVRRPAPSGTTACSRSFARRCASRSRRAARSPARPFVGHGRYESAISAWFSERDVRSL